MALTAPTAVCGPSTCDMAHASSGYVIVIFYPHTDSSRLTHVHTLLSMTD